MPNLPIIMMLVVLMLGPTDIRMSTPESSMQNCPVTQGSTTRPLGDHNPFQATDLVIQQDGIWVTVPRNGVLELGPNHAITFGPHQGWRTSFHTWMRDPGVEGFVIVHGTRLDVSGSLEAVSTLSPQRQYVKTGPVKTAIAFPSEGCWEITATVGEHEIQWVMWVEFAD